MVVNKKTLRFLLFALACTIVLRSFVINIEYNKKIPSHDDSISIASFCFGELESSNQTSPTSSNHITFPKKLTQIGNSHYSFSGYFFTKFFPVSHISTHKPHTQKLFNFFVTSWFMVFGLKKIII